MHFKLREPSLWRDSCIYLFENGARTLLNASPQSSAKMYDTRTHVSYYSEILNQNFFLPCIVWSGDFSVYLWGLLSWFAVNYLNIHFTVIWFPGHLSNSKFHDTNFLKADLAFIPQPSLNNSSTLLTIYRFFFLLTAVRSWFQICLCNSTIYWEWHLLSSFKLLVTHSNRSCFFAWSLSFLTIPITTLSVLQLFYMSFLLVPLWHRVCVACCRFCLCLVPTLCWL